MITETQDLHVLLGRSHAEIAALKAQLREAVDIIGDILTICDETPVKETRAIERRANAFYEQRAAALAKAEAVSKETP